VYNGGISGWEKVYNGGYTQGVHRVGIPSYMPPCAPWWVASLPTICLPMYLGVYTGLYALPMYPGGIHTLVYTTLPYTPEYTLPPYTAGHRTTLLWCNAGCLRVEPWAQGGRFPWVRAFCEG